MLLLDTHVLIWLDEANPKLGKHALSIIDQALKNNELYVSTISFWEVAMLVRKGRLEIKMDLRKWRQSLIKNGLKEVPLSGGDAMESGLLQNFHGDPADRMIVATAINADARLCTADPKVLSWESNLCKIDARK